MSASRRRFIRIAVLGAATAPLLGQSAWQAAVAADLPHLTTADATAAALGYTEDSSTVDAGKYPNHKVDQVCANCNLGQAPQADGYLPCSIFPGKAVHPKGWCAAYVKKP
jgi:hypothetical protein